MRRTIFAAAASMFAVFAAHDPAAAAPQTLELHADHVSYFSNRYIVQGDGHVTVRIARGPVVTGQFFSMDLKLNRYVVAGDVHVSGAGLDARGAGWAGFVNLDRSYLLTAAGEPDRWAFAGTDYAHPLKGREQPGDAYYLPDLSAEKPWIRARGARIYPGTAIELRNSSVYVFGAYVPTANYVVNFSPNPNFAQNALAGATADVGVPFHGGSDAISAAHLRYDSLRGAYLSFDEHGVHDRNYAVVSVNPITQHYKQFNGIFYDRLSPRLEARSFVQLNTEQSNLSLPYEAASYANLTIVGGLRRSSMYVSIDQYNYGLVHPFIDAPLYNAVRHPADVNLGWNGFENRLASLPVYFQLRSSISTAHDTYGVGSFAGTPFDTIWQHTLGGVLYTHAVKTDRFGSLTLSFDKQRTWYDMPMHVDTTVSTATYARTYPRFASLLTYQVRNVGQYAGKYQVDIVPYVTDAQTDAYGTFTGLNAFRGLATSRSWTATEAWTPNPNLAVNVQLRRSYDFPAPVPGLGGAPPWQATYDLRVRLARQILLDLQRSYYFNFANNRWQPQFQVQFSP